MPTDSKPPPSARVTPGVSNVTPTRATVAIAKEPETPPEPDKRDAACLEFKTHVPNCGCTGELRGPISNPVINH